MVISTYFVGLCSAVLGTCWPHGFLAEDCSSTILFMNKLYLSIYLSISISLSIYSISTLSNLTYAWSGKSAFPSQASVWKDTSPPSEAAALIFPNFAIYFNKIDHRTIFAVSPLQPAAIDS